MKNYQSIRNTYVRQKGQNDCGHACLAMIFNYCAKWDASAAMSADVNAEGAALSLLAMREISTNAGIKSKCVQMDVETLRKMKTPLILHFITDFGESHFIVCYGAIKQYGAVHYLVGDPARQIMQLSEPELLNRWQSKTALVFENINNSNPKLNLRLWLSLFSAGSLPPILWMTIPLLNLAASLLGIGLSWALQRGIQDSFTDKKQSVLIGVTLLLCIITLFKSLVTYTRQRVLIKLNNTVNQQYVIAFIKRLVLRTNSYLLSENSIRMRIGDIQKIQNAVSNFVAIMLSDGSLILFLLSALFYLEPVVALINSIYISLLLIIGIRNSPFLLYNTAYLNTLSANIETALMRDMKFGNNADITKLRLNTHMENQYKFLSAAKSIATRIVRFNLLYECIGTVSVIGVFGLSLFKLDRIEISYSTLMILVISSYFITALMPKICNALVVISEGVEAARLFNSEAPRDQP